MKQNRLKHPGNAFTRGNPSGLPIAYKNRNDMKTRVTTNWKTTLIGAIIAAGVFAAILTGKITWMEGSGFLLASGILAWMKDK